MDVVLDSNTLFRTLISGGDIVDLFFDRNLKIYAPEKLKEELEKHKEEIIEKSHLSKEEVDRLVEIILEIVEFVPAEKYGDYLVSANELLKEHKKDEDFVALALSKNCKIWCYEKRIFEIGFGVSTKEIADELREMSQ